MSFLPINEQNQMAPQGQTTNAPTSQGNVPSQSGGSAGAGAGGGAAKGTPAGSSAGTPTQFGSSASKLGDYLSANAPQIQGQANNVAQGLNTQYGQVGTDINSAANQFNQQVAGGYAAPNQDVVNQALANPTQFASNANNVSAFQGQLNDTYTGPQNFESTTPYSNIQNEVNSAVQNAGLLNTQAGLTNYLQQTGTNPNATQASNTLDTLLLTGNPQANQTVQTAANQFQNLTPQFQNSVTAADQGVTAAQQAAANAAQYAQGQFNPYVQNFSNTVNTNAQNQIAQQQASQAALLKDIGGIYNQPADTSGTTLGTYHGGTTPWYNTTNYAVNNTLTPQDLQQLGVTQDQWNALQGAMQQAGTSQMMNGRNFGAGSPTSQIDLTQFLQQSDPTQYINAGNTATADQYATAAALQQLGGANVNTGLNQANIAQAGTAPTNLNQFLYNNALTGSQNTAAEARSAAQQEANDLTANADTQHNAEKKGGLFSSGLGGFLGAAINPATWIPNAINVAENKPVSGSNYYPQQLKGV